MDYFTSTHGITSPDPNSVEDLIATLNRIGDEEGQAYLNPIRSQIVSSIVGYVG